MNRSFPRSLVFAVLVMSGAAALVIARKRAAPSGAGSTNLDGLVSQESVNRFIAIEGRENELNKTVWAKEMLAEECGQVFDSLWDALNAGTNKFAVLASFPVGELTVG